MKKSLLTLFFCLTFLPTAKAWQFLADRANQKGVEALKKENNQQAYQSFLEGLSHSPMDPTLKLNLGFTFYLNEEYAKALKESRSVAQQAKDSDGRFYGYFNAAKAAEKLKDIPLALSLYQKALAERPQSKEVKTNIELLFQGGEGEGEGEQQSENPENQDQKQPNEGSGEQEQKNPPPEGKGQQPEQKKQQPKPFQSQELTDDDVRKILEELKDQENRIRANEMQKGAKEAPRDKDW